MFPHSKNEYFFDFEFVENATLLLIITVTAHSEDNASWQFNCLRPNCRRIYSRCYTIDYRGNFNRISIDGCMSTKCFEQVKKFANRLQQLGLCYKKDEYYLVTYDFLVRFHGRQNEIWLVADRCPVQMKRPT